MIARQVGECLFPHDRLHLNPPVEKFAIVHARVGFDEGNQPAVGHIRLERHIHLLPADELVDGFLQTIQPRSGARADRNRFGMQRAPNRELRFGTK